MADSALVGKTGAITGRVAPGTVGEIAVSIRGGTESYFARPSDGQEVIERGRQALIVGTAPGRTVFVTAFDVF